MILLIFPMCVCVWGGGGGVCVCVCVWGGGGIFDPLTFTTLWANSADNNLLVFLNNQSPNILLF